MFKLIVVVLLILVIASLFNSLVALLQDSGAPNKDRLLRRLLLRAGLAFLLVATMSYGFYSGQLRSQAPWTQQLVK